MVASAAPPLAENSEAVSVPAGCSAITSPIAGSVWKLATAVGARVQAGDPVVIVEAMKTEIAVAASANGRFQRLVVSPGAPVLPGQVLAFLEDAWTPSGAKLPTHRDTFG